MWGADSASRGPGARTPAPATPHTQPPTCPYGRCGKRHQAKPNGDLIPAGRDGAPGSFPQQVVAAIHAKWRAQSERAIAYRRLFALTAFLALMLGVLFSQRGAANAFRVHETLESVLAPPPNGVQSAEGVYEWLGGVLQVRGEGRPCWCRTLTLAPALVPAPEPRTEAWQQPVRIITGWTTHAKRHPHRLPTTAPQAVWKDPVCGDGLCETPFEFASYGRFGCRADCGALIDLQRLTSLDIDLYYNFDHQAGSLPAAVSAALEPEEPARKRGAPSCS